MFDALGEIEQSITDDWPRTTKEMKQYITYESMKKNFHKVFKIKNDFFAKVFYLYLAQRRPLNTKVNYQMWLERLMPFWMGCTSAHYLNQIGRWGWDASALRKEKLKFMNQAVYEILNISGEKAISILDLVEMCAHF